MIHRVDLLAEGADEFAAGLEDVDPVVHAVADGELTAGERLDVIRPVHRPRRAAGGTRFAATQRGADVAVVSGVDGFAECVAKSAAGAEDVDPVV